MEKTSHTEPEFDAGFCRKTTISCEIVRLWEQSYDVYITSVVNKIFFLFLIYDPLAESYSVATCFLVLGWKFIIKLLGKQINK